MNINMSLFFGMSVCFRVFFGRKQTFSYINIGLGIPPEVCWVGLNFGRVCFFIPF